MADTENGARVAKAESHATRRSLIAFALAAPVAIALVGESEACPPARAAWDAAQRRASLAREAVDRDDPILDEIRRRWTEANPSEDIVHFRSLGGMPRHEILHGDIDKLEADFMGGEGKWWWASEAGKQRHAEAFESAREFRRLRVANPHNAALKAAQGRNELLDEERYAAEQALWAMEAPDSEALRNASAHGGAINDQIQPRISPTIEALAALCVRFDLESSGFISRSSADVRTMSKLRFDEGIDRLRSLEI